jgi:hypothetical protein
MKKIILFLLVLQTIVTYNTKAQFGGITFDPTNYAQNLITAGSTKLTALATEKISALAGEQLAAAQKTLDEAFKANKINLDQFNLEKKYQEYLQNPNNNFSGGPYASVEATYRRVVSMTDMNIMAAFWGTMQSKLSNDDLAPYRASVSLFIAAARNNAEDLKTKVDAIKSKQIFTMNDAERLNLIDKYQYDMSILLGAIKLYYARVVKILVAKKGVSSSSLGWLQKVIS